MSDSMNQHRTFEVLTAEPVRSRRKPRHWSDEEKAQLVADTFAPGANVSAIARSHGLDPSQLYGWRRKALSSGMVAPMAEDDTGPVKFTRFEATSGGMIEIVVGDVVVRAGGDIDPDHLARVLRAVRTA